MILCDGLCDVVCCVLCDVVYCALFGVWRGGGGDDGMIFEIVCECTPLAIGRVKAMSIQWYTPLLCWYL